MSETGITLSGKRVVIIGGASGIGFAVAKLARECGASIVIASTNADKIQAAVAELGGGEGLPVDLRDEASIGEFFDKVGAFDHLAITAGDWGGPMFVPLQDLDMQSARDLFTVRFWGVLAAVKAAARTIAQDGSIVLTGGMAAHRPTKGGPLATALSGATEHLARGLAMDLAPVRVNAVSPGIILTDVVKQMPKEVIDGFVGHLPIARAADPSEAARAYLYLLTNTYITGQIVPVDGGGLLV